VGWYWLVGAEYLTNTKSNTTHIDLNLYPICYIALWRLVRLAEIEHPERYIWWLNELESLGVNTLEKHGLNNHKEAKVFLL
jgi:hypothetical protein